MPIPLNPQWRQKVWDARQRELIRYARHRGLTTDQYTELADQWLRSALMQMEPFTRIMASDLISALSDGVFKTQFDTGTSRGVLDTGARAQTEEALFGISPSASGIARPYYGYLHANQDGLLGSTDAFLIFYGKIAVRLVHAIKERTTFVIGDTSEDTRLGTEPTVSPTPVYQPSWLSVSTSQGDVLIYPDVDAFLRDIDNPSNEMGYIEAHYHGTVTIEDIAEVIFSRAGPTPILRSYLDRSSIPWRRVQ